MTLKFILMEIARGVCWLCLIMRNCHGFSHASVISLASVTALFSRPRARLDQTPLLPQPKYAGSGTLEWRKPQPWQTNIFLSPSHWEGDKNSPFLGLLILVFGILFKGCTPWLYTVFLRCGLWLAPPLVKILAYLGAYLSWLRAMVRETRRIKFKLRFTQFSLPI